MNENEEGDSSYVSIVHFSGSTAQNVPLATSQQSTAILRAHAATYLQNPAWVGGSFFLHLKKGGGIISKDMI